MVLKLKEKEQHERQKKMSRENAKINSDVTMLVVSVAVAVIGVYVTYFSYMRLGITTVLNVCLFILGITLSVTGLQRLFESIGSIIEKRTGLFITPIGFDNQEWKCVSPFVSSDEITFEESGIRRVTTYIKGTQNRGGLEEGILFEWDCLGACVFEKDSVVILFSEDMELQYCCLCLSDTYDGFDFAECVEEIRKHIPEDRVHMMNDNHSYTYVFNSIKNNESKDLIRECRSDS